MEDPTSLRALAPVSLMILIIPFFFFFLICCQTPDPENPSARFQVRIPCLELGSDLLQLPAQHDLPGQVSLPRSGVKYVMVHPEVGNLLKLR